MYSNNGYRKMGRRREGEREDTITVADSVMGICTVFDGSSDGDTQKEVQVGPGRPPYADLGPD